MAKLLVVDDEVGIRELLSEILEDEGHDVLTAEDAGQARKLIEENPLDLILLDIWMPDTDGVTLLRELSSQHLIHCPVIMMSGHATAVSSDEVRRFRFPRETDFHAAPAVLGIERSRAGDAG